MDKKANIQPYTFQFWMPREYDFSSAPEKGVDGQVTLAYQNMEFDEKKEILDPQSNTPLLALIKKMPEEDIQKFLWKILKQNNNVRHWLKHLFARDFDSIAHSEKPGVNWHYLAGFPPQESSFLQEHPTLFNLMFTNDPNSPQIAVEENKGTRILRIRESAFGYLYERTRERITDALGLL